MKNLILTTALALVLATTSATAGTEEDCSNAASVVFEVAKARDVGIGPEVILNTLTGSGLDSNLAAELVEFVYLTGSTLSPKELKDVVFAGCVSGLT